MSPAKTYDLTRLPGPDHWGCYWFGQPGAGGTPCLLPIESYKHLLGKYLVSLGAGGVLFEGAAFRAFDSPEAGLRELRRRLARQ